MEIKAASGLPLLVRITGSLAYATLLITSANCFLASAVEIFVGMEYTSSLYELYKWYILYIIAMALSRSRKGRG